MIRAVQWLVMASVFMLTACGFHLKGVGGDYKPLPFHTVYVNGKSSLADELRADLRKDKRIQVLTEPKGAQAVLTLSNELQQKDALTINSAGSVNEYVLVYSVFVHVVLNGVDVDPDMTLTVRRTMTTSTSATLGKDQEESLLWIDARKDAADQIVRRLAYIQVPGGSVISGPQSAKPANARTQP